MNDNEPDNVVSLKTRQSFRAEQAQAAQQKSEVTRLTKDEQLAVLDNVRKLLEADVLDSFVIVAHSNKGVFLTEVALPAEYECETVYSLTGALGCVHLEMQSLGQMMPQMLNDGTIVSPEIIVEMEE